MFTITHVLILEGPPKYQHETEPYHNTLWPENKLPKGFAIKPTWGDAFLTYKDDGTVHTICRRCFFQRKNGGWESWPWHKKESPQQYAEREGITIKNGS